MGLVQKLQIKDLQHFFVVNCPEDLTEALKEEGLEQQVSFNDYKQGGVLLFIRHKAELGAMISGFIQDPSSDNHWVAFPKRSSKIPTDMGRDHGWDQFISANWIAVRQVSINEQWSTLRFRPRAVVKEVRRGTDYPGIDSKKKTVTIPESLDSRLQREGLKEVFEGLSFTKRKEAVISILQAKKPETLERRIIKIIESLT
ncbi:MAG: YdeI/OmpD-associated family protein [Cytophagales bacterium]|nr:YdeI/OmpD-associated family protein [Cytophagales bacterium]